MTNLPKPPPPPDYIPPTAHPERERYNPRELPLKIERCAEYDAETANHILDRVEEGCRLEQLEQRQGGKRAATVLRWVRLCPDFSEAYADALEIQAEVYADQIVGIADDSSLKVMERKQKIDTREKVMSFNNVRFIRRNATELSGPNGSPLSMQHDLSFKKKSEMTPEQFAEVMDELWLSPLGGPVTEEVHYSIPTGEINNLEVPALAKELRKVPKDKLQAALNRYAG